MSTSSHSFDALPGPPPPVPLPDWDIPAEVYAEVARLGLANDFPAAIALTRELFGGFTIDISVDPEIYRCSYVTFNVHCRDTIDAVQEKKWEWFGRAQWPAQAEGSFCLSVSHEA